MKVPSKDSLALVSHAMLTLERGISDIKPSPIDRTDPVHPSPPTHTVPRPQRNAPPTLLSSRRQCSLQSMRAMISSSSRMMATRQPMRMAVGLPSALATGCWPRGSSSNRGEWSAPQQESCRTRGGGPGGTEPKDCSPKLLKLVGGGPGGHQGAGGKESEESFITSGEKEAKRRASQSRGPEGTQVRET